MTTDLERLILRELGDLVFARAARGNAQSKHGPQAAQELEIFKLRQALDEMMEKNND